MIPARPEPRPVVSLRLCGVEAAMQAARERALAVVLDGEGEFLLAFTTPFGPCLRRHPAGEDLGFLGRVLRESVRGDYSAVALACARPDDAGRVCRRERIEPEGVAHGFTPEQARAAVDAFMRTRPAVPVHSGLGSAARARSCTVAPCPGVSYETGAVLRPRIEDRPEGAVIRWLAAGGADAGIHLVLDRAPTGSECSLVAGVEARVVSVVPGSMPFAGGSRRVQTLMLDVPHAFAEAFPDGRIPRHGLEQDPRT